MPQLSVPIESIPPMDILVALGRGPNDRVRAELVVDIASHVAFQHDAGYFRRHGAAFLGPLVYLCGNEPWHRSSGEPDMDDRRAEAMSTLGHVHSLIDEDREKYGRLTDRQFITVGGNSTIASMVEIAESTAVLANPEASITFLTDDLHDKYGRVGRSALAVFGRERPISVITYPRPRVIKEELMEPTMTFLTRYALRTVNPGDSRQALEAQRKIEDWAGRLTRTIFRQQP